MPTRLHLCALDDRLLPAAVVPPLAAPPAALGPPVQVCAAPALVDPSTRPTGPHVPAPQTPHPNWVLPVNKHVYLKPWIGV